MRYSRTPLPTHTRFRYLKQFFARVFTLLQTLIVASTVYQSKYDTPREAVCVPSNMNRNKTPDELSELYNERDVTRDPPRKHTTEQMWFVYPSGYPTNRTHFGTLDAAIEHAKAQIMAEHDIFDTRIVAERIVGEGYYVYRRTPEYRFESPDSTMYCVKAEELYRDEDPQ